MEITRVGVRYLGDRRESGHSRHSGLGMAVVTTIDNRSWVSGSRDRNGDWCTSGNRGGVAEVTGCQAQVSQLNWECIASV